MAERVIVIVRGRLAAAGGRHAIRDAMDDVPRQVLVRCAERSAAGCVARRAPRRGRGDGGRASDLVISTTRARDLAIALPRSARDLGIHLSRGAAARRLAREPVPGARAMTARPPPPAAGDRAIVAYTLRTCCPASAGRRPGAVRRGDALRVSSLGGSASDRRARVRHGGRRRAVRPGAAGDLPRRRRRRPRRGGAQRLVRLHLAVAGRRPGRSPSLAGWVARSWPPGCLVVAFALAAVVAGAPSQRWLDRHRRRVRRHGVRRRVHRHRLRGPAGCSLVARVRLPRRAAARRRPQRHRAAVPRLGGPGGVRRASPTRTTASLAAASPRAPAALVRLALITAIALVVASRRLAHLKLSGSTD